MTVKMLDLQEIHLKINSDPLMFRRFEKIDWKKFASLNLESFTSSGNSSSEVIQMSEMIERNLGNILCCHLESEFDPSALDPNLAKLFRLAQLAVEYLLRLRQQALSELKTCREQLAAKEEALNTAERMKNEAERRCKDMKKGMKKLTAVAAISNRPTTTVNNESQFYRCPACPKTFLNGEYLRGHWQRRHPVEFTVVRDSYDTSWSPSADQVGPVKKVPDSAEPTKIVRDTTVDGVDELKELKDRLLSAEKALQDERQILHTLFSKMDQSSVQLQGILVQEVQKIKESLFTPASPVSNVSLPNEVNDPEPKTGDTIPKQEEKPSPVPRKSVEVQVSAPDVCQEVIAVAGGTPRPPSDNESVDQFSYQKTEPVSQPITKKVHVVAVSKEAPIRPSSGSEEDDSFQRDIRSIPVINTSAKKKKQKKSRPVDVDRKVLASRFKNTVERTLQRRLESMGVENSGAVPTTQFRRVMDQLELTQQKSGREFERTRRRFLAELQCRTDPSSDKKSDTPKVKNKKKASSQMVAVTPSPSAGNRAPVPTPRTGRMSHLMARDGEASSVNVKDLTRNLEHKVAILAVADGPSPGVNALDPYLRPQHHSPIFKPTPQKPSVNEAINPDNTNKLEKEIVASPVDPIAADIIVPKSDEDEDSFSLSSLDAILNELKNPNRFKTNGAPPAAIMKHGKSSATKSVQWRVPVETMEKPLDQSWDS